MTRVVVAALGSLVIAGAVTFAQAPRPMPTPAPDPIGTLVGRLDLERYKATIKGLTQFGDRREGTARNRRAVDWIEAQLKAGGCTNTERLTYQYAPRPAAPAGSDAARQGRGGSTAAPAPGSATPPPVPAAPATPPAAGTVVPQSPQSVGGGRPRGIRTVTTVNTDPMRQPDARLRELNREPSVPGSRDEVYCTKVGRTRPDEMYIVAAHMDGHGWGEAANDNGSGTAIVMELARLFSAPDVVTDRSIRFILWNNEETGLNGSAAYAAQRKDLQGREQPPGSGRYPEPRWLGMIQHDMMLFDHGAPRPDGTLSKEQRPEADVNVEFQLNSARHLDSQALAWALQRANEKYATDYPVAIGSHMTNTDSSSFMDLVPSVSVRENERGTHIGSGWDPQWHQPTDVFATYHDKDFRLGLNAAQTTLAAVADLVGAALTR